jgi:hypothetical protein
MAMGIPSQNEDVKGKSSIDSINGGSSSHILTGTALSEIAVAAKEHLTSMLWPLQPGPHRRGQTGDHQCFSGCVIGGFLGLYKIM